MHFSCVEGIQVLGLRVKEGRK